MIFAPVVVCGRIIEIMKMLAAHSLPNFCEVVEVAVGGGEFLEIAGQIGLAVKFAKATELLQRLHLY